ncbi:MAG: transglycosylase SLT domain-containing protein [Betaproteobacteria bacterium]
MHGVRIAGLALMLLSACAGASELELRIAALRMGVDEGDGMAQVALAARYEHAEGLPRDPGRAHALYCLAAREGDADAQYRLGWMYANGRGVARDDAVAAELFGWAAARGHAYAARALQYVRAGGAPRMPACLEPDPPLRLAVSAEPEAEAASIESDPAPAGEMRRLVHRLALQYGVEPRLALAVTAVESGFNARAVSPKNAQGLMQLIPATAQRFGVRRAFDPEENVRGGLAYLRWLLALFRGDVRLAVAAYNAGERAVERHRGVPPYAETRDYVRKVAALYGKAAHPFDAALAEPSPVLARAAATRP